MSKDCVLIIDDDSEAVSSLSTALTNAGVEPVWVNDAFLAIERLRERRYCAVVLDPIIRRGLNGYAVLDFLETEQPEMIPRLFLLTGMSEQTIRRTAPAVLDRLFRKPSGYATVARAVLEQCVTRECAADSRGARWILHVLRRFR